MDTGLTIIAEFLAHLARTSAGETYYRGHADEDWKVLPSAFRERTYGITNETELTGWRRVSSRFANPRPQNPLEWLVLAQHYGVPTTLLDWTSNPLIALFFATEKAAKPDKTGVVLRFPRKSFQVLRTPEKTKPFLTDRKKPGLLDTSSMNPRTLAQDSVMSIHCAGCEEIAIAEDNIAFKVDPKSKHRVRAALKQFGISADRLYSDISVAAREYASELETIGVLG